MTVTVTTMADKPTTKLSHLSNLTPASPERTWLTAPHPTLPIVATCSSDKTVRLYSLTNFHLLSTISGGHKRSVRTCAWKPHVTGESVLATGSFDATVGIWRRWDQTQDENPTPTEHDDEDEEEWRFAVLLDGHDSEVKSVSWSPSGMLLATCSRDKSIWLWEDLDDGDNNFETVAVMQEHAGDVKCVAWHPVEECLASASYDDTIRLWREDLDDWGQVACLRGHGGTVWCVDWEGVDNLPSGGGESSAQWKTAHTLSGPRLVSCSDDRTVRIWRRQPQQPSNTPDIPSIIRPTGTDEIWSEECTLPPAHDLSVYAVAWSKRSGLLASVGADGRVVVYVERLVAGAMSEWTILATVDAAHGIYEINHVVWAKRADRGRRLEVDDEEVLITTADDGSVKVWTIMTVQ